MGFCDGDATGGRGSRRPGRDLGRDTTFARARLLRPAADIAEGGWLRRFRRGCLQAVLCGADGRAVIAARPLFSPHMVGYFEGIDSERGIVWRCSDSLSLRDFLRLANRDKVPDHSWLSKTRSRLPHEVHEKVFGWVLALVAERGLVKGERIGVDGSTMEANAALRTIVRRDTSETYRRMLTRMAEESGVATPTIDELIRLDRKRKGKKLSNEDWTSPTDPDCQDHQDEGRHDTSGLQTRTRGRSRHRRHRRRINPPRRPGGT